MELIYLVVLLPFISILAVILTGIFSRKNSSDAKTISNKIASSAHVENKVVAGTIVSINTLIQTVKECFPDLEEYKLDPNQVAAFSRTYNFVVMVKRNSVWERHFFIRQNNRFHLYDENEKEAPKPESPVKKWFSDNKDHILSLNDIAVSNDSDSFVIPADILPDQSVIPELLVLLKDNAFSNPELTPSGIVCGTFVN